jgi:hypothetical protein
MEQYDQFIFDVETFISKIQLNRKNNIFSIPEINPVAMHKMNKRKI